MILLENETNRQNGPGNRCLKSAKDPSSLPVVTCSDADRIAEGDELEVDAIAGKVVNRTRRETYQAEPLPAFVAQIASAGGILDFIKRYGWEGNPEGRTNAGVPVYNVSSPVRRRMGEPLAKRFIF